MPVLGNAKTKSRLILPKENVSYLQGKINSSNIRLMVAGSADRPSDKNQGNFVAVGFFGIRVGTNLEIRPQRQIVDSVNSRDDRLLGELIEFWISQRGTENQQSSITSWQKVNKRFVFRIFGPKVENDTNSENRLVNVVNDKARSRKDNRTNCKSRELFDPT